MDTEGGPAADSRETLSDILSDGREIRFQALKGA